MKNGNAASGAFSRGPKSSEMFVATVPNSNSSREAMSPSRKFESAIRAAVGRLAPGMARDGYDRAMYYIGSRPITPSIRG